MSPRVSRFAPQPVVLPIAGGKGGIGKSVIAANLALALARLEHRVILIDADLGGSDLHNILGLANDRPGLGEVLTGRDLAINDVIAPLTEPRLAFAPGDAMVAAAANPGFQKKRKLLHAINHLDADFVLLDLGAGTAITVMDFYLASPLGLVVMLPERPALLSAFNFLKNVSFRALERTFTGNSACGRALAGFQARSRGPGAMAMAELSAELEAARPGEGLRARRTLERVRPKLVVNRARSVDDFACARQLADWAAAELGLMVEVLGFLPEDIIHAAAAEAGAPALDADPRAPFCQAMARLGLIIGQWSGRGAQWALQRDFTGGFERAATEFAGVFKAKA
ncbi:MAG: P-loop NTPase [Pseudomonadota bacterium]